jgi:hypothetical protein
MVLATATPQKALKTMMTHAETEYDPEAFVVPHLPDDARK